MSVSLLGSVLLGSMSLLLVLGIPIAMTMGLASVTAIWVQDIPIAAVAQRMVNSADSFPLMAIPFFLLAGSVMTASGMAMRLVNLLAAMVGFVRGGLVMVNIVANMFMAGVSGSSVADAAAVGSTLVRLMGMKGYDKPYAAASIAAASTIAVIIPPSIPMVLYGVISGESIARLFVAGIIPGVLTGLALMGLTYYHAVRHPEWFPTETFPGWGAMRGSARDAFWALLMPVIILGGILTGIVTPTEASVLAAVYALIIGMLVYRTVSLGTLRHCLWETVIGTASTMFLVATAGLFGWLLAFFRVPHAMAEAMAPLVQSPILLMLVINIVLFILGTFMDLTAQLIICTPVLLPIMIEAGFSPIHFGIVLIVNLAIGLITPPTAVCLNVLCQLSGVSLNRITRTIMPMMVIMCGVLLLISYWPATVLWLPELLLPNK